MLQVDKISKSFGGKKILDEVTFKVANKEKVALVGPNGSGKSTLFKILAGKVEADSGSFCFGKEARWAYLPQSFEDFTSKYTTVEEMLYGASVELGVIKTKLSLLEEKLSREPNDQTSLTKYGELQQEFSEKGGYELEVKAKKILSNLGLGDIDLQKNLCELSGGQKTKIGFVSLLISEPNFLLLDEPTNHLDLPTLVWLEKFLKSFSGSVLLVSHDRKFLDNLAEKILELDERTGKIKEYVGNYTDYVFQKSSELEKIMEKYEDYRKEKRRLKESMLKLKGWSASASAGENRSDSSKPFGSSRTSADRSAKTASRAKNLEKRLLKLEEKKVWRPKESWQMSIDFGNFQMSGEKVFECNDLSFSYGPAKLLKEIDLLITRGERIALMGQNGSGKTTLLKIIGGSITPGKGSVKLGANVKIGFLPQEINFENPDIPAVEDFSKNFGLSKSASISFLHKFLFLGENYNRSLGDLSLGEKAKYQLAKMIAAGSNFLLLDEPTNHLDFPSLSHVEEMLSNYAGTILVVSHDRAFLENIGVQKAFWLSDGILKKFHNLEWK